MNRNVRKKVEKAFNLKIKEEQCFPWGKSSFFQFESNDTKNKKNIDRLSRSSSIVTVYPNVEHKSHIHPGYEEILYGLEGETIHSSNNNHFILRKGNLGIIYSGEQHIMVNNTDMPAQFLSIVYPTIPDMGETITIEDVELLELVKITNLDTILGKLADNASLSVSLIDVSGNLLNESDKFPTFCKLCIREKLGNCIINQNNCVNSPEYKLSVFCCKFNVYSVQSPITINGRLLGYLGCGYGRKTLPSQEKNLIKKFFSEEVHKIALKEYFKLGFANHHHLNSVAEVLALVSSSLVRVIIQAAREKQIDMYKLNLSIDKQRKAELENTLNEAKFRLLEAQVNPHFLFNTLNTIAQASFMEGAHTAASLTHALANLLRCSLGKVENLISIKEEMNYVNDYLFIQKNRFSTRFTVEVRVSYKVEKVKIPFMTIMVLVENSIIHGFSNISYQGQLIINAFLEDGFGVIQVIDNGCGLSDEIIEQVNAFKEESTLQKSTFKGIGLKNIYKRLQYYYGDNFEFNISVMKGKKTRVIIKLPLVE
ncbi:MAG: hypothetical protein VR72_13035 [Clostridiaceae bacterium BRH_c20a]|nr:MAG: hypothetical protein VR72_13035 [Clostridiaceae bacterium BRH_c20a]